MIDAAASHAIHLMQQGKTANGAVRRAAFRFGVSPAAILAEVEDRRALRGSLGNEADDLIEAYYGETGGRPWGGVDGPMARGARAPITAGNDERVELVDAATRRLPGQRKLLASRLRRAVRGTYGDRAARDAVITAAQALTGDDWQRTTYLGNFPETCSICGTQIISGQIFARHLDSGKLAHDSCAAGPPASDRVEPGIEPAMARLRKVLVN